jgi:prepilin-type N-terminal cleavage/methylation domain-containing protein
MQTSSRKGFTLIELLVVVAIIAVLAVVVVLTLNPQALLQQSRDANRVSDMSTLVNVLGQYNTDQSGYAGFTMGSSSVVYVSIPDPSATTTAGDQCQGLGLLTLPATYSYHCAASSTYRNVNGAGWIPINFQTMSTGAPLGSLPVDSTNTSSSRLYYTYTTNGTQYEVTSPMESVKYQVGGSNDVISGDGGLLATVYEKGSQLGLEPLDYGDATLVRYYPLTEGANSIAYDDSGNNVTGTWTGTQSGSSGYYSAGKIGSYAGYFDGTDDRVTLSTSSITSPQFTVLAWYNESNSGGIFGQANSDMTCATSGDPWFEYSGVLNYYYVPGGPGGYVPGSYACPGPGVWTQIALTYDGNIATWYLNGLYDGGRYIGFSGTGLLVGNSSNYIGFGPYTGGYFQGYINDVRIYNRALSAAQIAAMYKAGK